MFPAHSHLSDFRLLSELGRGSYGAVYKARSRLDHRVYVIKQIAVSPLSSRLEKEAMREVQVLMQLEHPHIVKCFGSFVERGSVHIVMEFAEGGDLHKMLKDRKDKGHFVPEALIWRFARELSAAVSYLHQLHIIHRDIKPMNVLLTKDLKVKLADLGASKTSSDCGFYTTRIGTPLFLAPELVRQTAYNEKVDIWALGCVLYQLAALEPPFRGETQAALSNAIINHNPKPLPRMYSDRLAKVVFALLEKKVQDRPNSIEVDAMVRMRSGDHSQSFIGELVTAVETPQEEQMREMRTVDSRTRSAGKCENSGRRSQSHLRPAKVTVKCLQDCSEVHFAENPAVRGGRSQDARIVEMGGTSMRPKTSSVIARVLGDVGSLPELLHQRCSVLKDTGHLRKSSEGCRADAFINRPQRLQSFLRSPTIQSLCTYTYTPISRKKFRVADLV